MAPAHNKNTRAPSIRMAALVTMLLTLTACSKLSNENYNKLEAGMSKADVAAIIGEPESCESALAFETCRWGNDDKNIQVRFAADNLLAKTAEGL